LDKYALKPTAKNKISNNLTYNTTQYRGIKSGCSKSNKIFRRNFSGVEYESDLRISLSRQNSEIF